MDLGLKQDIEFYSKGNEKKVVLPSNRLKNWMKLGGIITLVVMIIVAVGNYIFRPEQTDNFLLILILPVVLVMFGAYWFFIRPTKIIITSNPNKVTITKIDLFYKKTYVEIEKSKKPFMVLRGRRMIGASVYVGKGKAHDIVIGWGGENEMRVRPILFSGVVHPSTLKKFTEKNIRKMAKHLNLKIKEK